MAIFKVVQHIGDLTDNSDGVVNSDSYPIKTGLYRISNAATNAAHFSINGNPNAGTDHDSGHILSGTEIIVKGHSSKSANIIAASAATSCVLTAEGNSQPFVVGEYVTLTGSSVSGYNTAVTHVEITAVSGTSITVNANTSSLAAFTGFATLSRSAKVSAQGDTNNGLEIYIDEVSIVAG
jgi:hypothetical protein